MQKFFKILLAFSLMFSQINVGGLLAIAYGEQENPINDLPSEDYIDVTEDFFSEADDSSEGVYEEESDVTEEEAVLLDEEENTEFEETYDNSEEEYATDEEDHEEEEEPAIEDPWEHLRTSFSGVLNNGFIGGILNPSSDEAHISIWSEPHTGSSVVNTLPFGTWVSLEGIAVDGEQIWYLISYEAGDSIHSGYIHGSNFITNHEGFLQWLAGNSFNIFGERVRVNPRARQAAARNATNLNAFPASYRPFIQAMINARPNWTFVPHNTEQDWNQAVAAQMVFPRNAVSQNRPASWRTNQLVEVNTAGTHRWYQASEAAVRHFLDPRNFLNEQDVFQFELLGFNSSAHTVAGTNAVLNGTFMHTSSPTGNRLANGRSYAQAFFDIGRSLNVSPFHLASRVRLEQGVGGTSGLISGNFPGFQNLFNYFNFGATAGAGGQADAIIRAGLTRAREEGWTTRDLALSGGAYRLSEWIRRGQNTLYFQKFDVAVRQRPWLQQFMQHIEAPLTEGRSVRNGYNAIGVMNNSFVFSIPVFNNMPGQAAPQPGQTVVTPPPAAPTATVSYRSHVQNRGWLSWVSNGGNSGTTGQSLRMEAINMTVDSNLSGGIQYRSHVQDIGWQNWASNGALSGTSGQHRRVEAIQIRLTGELANHFDVFYRVHAERFGWLDWASNGASAGTAGQSLRLESFQVVLVPRGGQPPGATRRPFSEVRTFVNYSTHIQNVGWQATRSSGQLSGTSGQGLRLEGIRINLSNQSVSGGIEYRTHVQDIGWQGWRRNNAISGTSGQSRRLEGIQIRLTGEMARQYDVYYRVHVQNHGWLDWARNGASAGTEGRGLRLEAIEIVLVRNGDPAPGRTQRPFIR
ncbi:MAG: hypothetical protein FWF59_02415 [Turicibacter sp.]|nr:hypothetical protein [Turicibacter sp.]